MEMIEVKGEIRRTHINNKRFLKKLDEMEFGWEIERFLLRYILTDDQINFIWGLNKVRQRVLFQTQPVTEAFIRKHIEGISLGEAVFYVPLSEDFIREYKDELSWPIVCEYQKLSPDFIREMKDKVEWNNVSFFQKINYDFVFEFRKELDWEALKSNSYLNRNKICDLSKKFCYNLMTPIKTA